MVEIIETSKWFPGSQMVTAGYYGVQMLECPLLPADEMARAEPAPTGSIKFLKVNYFRVVPSWWNEDDVFIVVQDQMKLPKSMQRGFFFDFEVPERTAVMMSVLRTNPRTGELVDPSQGIVGLKLRFPDDETGQNFYTPGATWPYAGYCMTWVDGGRVDASTIRQFVFVDRSSGLSLDDYAIPKEFRGSDTITVAYWPFTAAVPKGSVYRDESRPMSYGDIGVALGGKMVQRTPDVPGQDFDGSLLWSPDKWAAQPETVVIRICPEWLYKFLMAHPDQKDFRKETPKQPRSGQDWMTKKDYPGPGQLPW